MIDLRLWEVLAAFDQEGTLQKAADFLHISQPAISQSLRKLEKELGVSLCIRIHRNRIELNETGKRAAKEARLLLLQAKRLEDQVRSMQTIQIGSCAPMPEWQLETPIHNQFGYQARFVLKEDLDELLNDLKNGESFIIVTCIPTDDPALYCRYWLTETLDLAVPKTHPLADKDFISLKDLEGQSLLLYKNIGYWNQVVQDKLPLTHFLRIDNQPTFRSASVLGAFPYFTSQSLEDNNPSVINLPLEGMELDFYLVCLKDNRDAVRFIQMLCQKDPDSYPVLPRYWDRD